MKKVRIFGVTFVLIMVYCSVVSAGYFKQRGGGSIPMQGPKLMRILEEIDLSDDQRTKVFNIIKKYRENNKEAMNKMHESRERLADTMQADEYNESSIRDAYKQVASNMEELTVSRAQMFSEIKPVLTHDQIETIKKMKAKMKKRRECRKSFFRSMGKCGFQSQAE